MSSAIRRILAARATADLAAAGSAAAPWRGAVAGPPGTDGVPHGFEAFTVGALGYFPYYWQDPTTLEFNAKTYEWISAGLRAGATPLELDARFTNLYTRALASISYRLSSADQARLEAARARTEEQQGALLLAWRTAGFPLTGSQPIDGVITTIASTWASPPTSLTGMRVAPSLDALLNQTPPAGEPVLPALANYLEALGSDVSLVNAATMNAGYLDQALFAVQSPTGANGGLETTDGSVRPRYAVATPVADILAGLDSSGPTSVLELGVEQVRSGTYRVEPAGESPFEASAADFLAVTSDDGAQDALQLATRAAPGTVRLTFQGVTAVYFGPVGFDTASGTNWFWMTPIRDAIRSGTADVSGFRFSPDPQIDFGAGGPFGFLTGVAISKLPTVGITASGADSASLAHRLGALAKTRWNVSLGGAPLLRPSASACYSCVPSASIGTVSLRFRPPDDAAASDPTAQTAFVLGVKARYPAD